MSVSIRYLRELRDILQLNETLSYWESGFEILTNEEIVASVRIALIIRKWFGLGLCRFSRHDRLRHGYTYIFELS